MRIHSAALKHGRSEGDILHALKHVHIELDVIDDDPPRTCIFGFAPDATLYGADRAPYSASRSRNPLHEGPEASARQSPTSPRRILT